MNGLKKAGASGLAVAALLLSAEAPAAPDLGWRTYVDPQFGTTITYPADVLPDRKPSETGIALSGGGAVLEISGMRLEDVRTTDDLRRAISIAPGYDNVTYSPEGRHWLVVSGYRGDDIFYEKFFLNEGIVRGFSFQYPEAERAFYDPLVEIMEDSFHVSP